VKFPFFDLTRQYATLKSEILPQIETLLDKQSLVMGEVVSQFEKEIADWIGVKHAITCASGSDAIILPLKVLGVKPGDEVITTPYSFFISTGAILWLEAKPVFVDINPETYNIHPDGIERLITKKTKAILPVHLYGQMAEMNYIMNISKTTGVPVLEDFAQSIGAKHDGKGAGTVGQIGATSFYPTKNLGGAGDGGLMTTNDDRLAEQLKFIRVHGMKKRYYHETLGVNSRLDALQCLYLRAKLKHLKKWTARRTELAKTYLTELAPLERQGLVLPKVAADKEHVWNQFIVRVPKRDETRDKLTELGIPTEIYYPLTIPEQEPLRGICSATGWKNSESAARNTLALPIFPELTNDEQRMVIDGFKKVMTL